MSRRLGSTERCCRQVSGSASHWRARCTVRPSSSYDEPNSNLDAAGEAALTQAIASIREQGNIAIVIAHRPSALASCNLIGVMQGGKLVAFGPKEEVLANHLQPTTANEPVARAAARKVRRT